MKRRQVQERTLDDMYDIYIDTKDDVNVNKEFEIKFGTKGKNAITKIKYQNVIKRLLSHGFVALPNSYMLRIMNEYTDNEGGTRESNIRTELEGLEDIQQYCKTNEIVNRETGEIELFVDFVQKQYPKIANEQILYPADVQDYNFRVSLANEITYHQGSGLVKQTIDQWNESKKSFRYINRIRFQHSEYPLYVDCSVVKTSKKQGFKLIPEYTIQEANVFQNFEGYEIEIELNNAEINKYTSKEDVKANLVKIKKVIKYVLSGLQETNYPIGYREEQNVLRDYMKLIQHRFTDTRKIKPRDFIGPSSKTLHIKHIQEVSEDSIVPNIRKDYTVTDKADGMRKLLYITKSGKMYFITTTMAVQFTGAVCKNKGLFESLMDGEHILHNKLHKYIHLYAPFDIYYINGRDVRYLPFAITDPIESKKNLGNTHRLNMLYQYVEDLKKNTELRTLRVEVKQFRFGKDIFMACKDILSHSTDIHFEYETDGLIFTPANMGVGLVPGDRHLKNKKITWEYSLKWKPSKFNTIDFYVTTNKNADKKEIIEYKYLDGKDVQSEQNILKYKTVTLRVGFNTQRDGYIHPCMDIIQDNIPKLSQQQGYEGDEYIPLPFTPTDPYDPKASQCNVELKMDNQGNLQMMTEEGDVFTDNMIIECSYDDTREGNWKWVPLRVRWDKTAELRAGFKNFGNGYNVANDNWHSIHHPVTEEMISQGTSIPPGQTENEDAYYVRMRGQSYTEYMRHFHNKYVKKMLITRVSKPGDTLIDLAVGKGGDISKWIDAKLSFVFGIDISSDNIHNRLDGACARYLNYRKRYHNMPHALFVQGNSGENIKDTTALYTERGKQITNSLFAATEKNEEKLGKGVFRQYGKAVDGFQVCSCQFAMHYFFESKDTLHQFLKNVTETTKVGGYFIGTSYDGSKLFKELSKKRMGDSYRVYYQEHKLCEIVKQYSETEFLNDDSCLGYAIDVYQETIGKMFREYLVNYDYFTQLIENYGFTLISNEEAKQLKLPNSTGLFNELFNEMKRYHKHNPEYESALKMTANEKRISFLNRYFIFKKVRVVNVDTIYMPNTKYQVAQEQVTKEELESAIQQEEQVFASIPPSALENNPRGIDNRPAWLVKQQEAAKAEIASEAPASEAPASEAPASVAAPASEAPASEAPASEAPASEAPKSEAPASEASASEAPASEAPASEASASEAPASEAPASEAPASEASVSEAPASEASVSVVASEAQPSLPSPALKSDESIETKDKKGGQQVRRLKTKIILR